MRIAVILILMTSMGVKSVSQTVIGRQPRFDRTSVESAAAGIEYPIPASQLRKFAVHDAGFFNLPIGCGTLPPYVNRYYPEIDPETGLIIEEARFPIGSDHTAIFAGALWFGGIVGDDTLVSVGADGWFNLDNEFVAPDPEQGGIIRTGQFADDEFLAVFTDTVTSEIYISDVDPFDNRRHIPLGLEISQKSYGWCDSLYDNFIIFDFMVRNILQNYIREGWIGIIIDPELYCDIDNNSWMGYQDDASGRLDTLLDDNDPGSRVFIGYAFDRDGDPADNSNWGENSSRYVMSLSLLETSIPDPVVNFNWWMSCGNAALDFGPRNFGTEQDPFRSFGYHLGTPTGDRNKYYLMSHQETDYNHLEMMVHDSADGWIPATEPYENYIHDSKILYSLGPVDLDPGDSITFALALVGSENFHVNPGDYTQYYSPGSPYAFQSHLDFTELMINHRRADSVYRSGYSLPCPGPPVGLRVVDYDDDHVELTWNASSHPDVYGYHLNVKDTVYDFLYHHAFPDPITDTSCILPVANPTHTHFLAVSLVDSSGDESALSMGITIIPARPYAPVQLTVTVDSLTPELRWQPGGDSGLAAYVIYRSVWNEPFEAYDSTLWLWYRDEAAESGVKYSYRLTSRHECGAESPPSDSVSVLTMVRDRGILFYNMNFGDRGGFGLYQRRYLDRLYYHLKPITTIAYYDVNDGDLPFKNMADYSVIVFDNEIRGGSFPVWTVDSIYNYLAYGGKGLFIIPNASTSQIGSQPPHTTVFSSQSLFGKILRLDSAVINGIALEGAICHGDLMGCSPEGVDFPVLRADSIKLSDALVEIEGFIPFSGCLYPRGEVDIFYRYQSMYADSIFHNRVNGVAYSDEVCSWVFFNFPLSLMEEPANIEALRAALTYLDVDVSCGDVNDDQRMDIGDAVLFINYLYREGPPPYDLRRADVNCDNVEDMEDVLAIINVIFRDGPSLGCCP